MHNQICALLTRTKGSGVMFFESILGEQGVIKSSKSTLLATY